MNNTINIDFYKPLLEIFCKSIAPYASKSKYPYGPFIPYTMSEYNNSNLKIFYIGRDTYYWISIDDMMCDFKNNSLENYLLRNSDTVNVDKMLEWKNNSGAFWTLVVKLHLYLKTGIYYDDVNQLSADEIELLQDIGYGNLNAIELPNSLIKEGEWDNINKNEYWIIKQESAIFDRLNLIINAYSPDYIYIFNWEDRDNIFEGLKYKWHEEYFEDKFRAVYSIEGHKTKVIWSSHPRRFSFLGTNMKEMVLYLSETLKMIQK